MKKLLVLLALAFVLCVPELFYAEAEKATVEAQLVDIDSEFKKTHWKLEGIVRNFKATIESIVPYHVVATLLTLELCSDCYRDSQAFLPWRSNIKEASNDAFGVYVVACLERDNQRLNERYMPLLENLYGHLTKPTHLYLVDKAKDIIRSTLPLYDKAIQILEAKQEKK